MTFRPLPRLFRLGVGSVTIVLPLAAGEHVVELVAIDRGTPGPGPQRDGRRRAERRRDIVTRS